MKNSTLKIIDSFIYSHENLKVCEETIKESLLILINCFKNGGKLLVCGNGGSASDSLHVAGELLKSFVLPRPIPKEDEEKIKNISENPDYLIKNLQGSLPVISLVSEISLMTAYSNDVAADLSFAQQVYGYGAKGDVLLAISTSGNSKNVVFAAEVAKIKDLKVISLTGKSGGKLKDLSDSLLAVPESETYKVQELHLPLYHALCLALENEFFGVD